MRKFFIIIIGIFMSFSLVKGEGYVLTTDTGPEGSLKFYWCTKGHIIDQGTADEAYWQKDVVCKYGIRWVILKNFEVLFDPPPLRYHYGKGPSSEMGFGDMDIGAKYVLAPKFAIQGFLRAPIGPQELPYWDDWAPKFSTGEKGYGVNCIISQAIFRGIKAHFNLGWLYNIGSYDEMPDSRTPIGLRFDFPYGLFVEGTMDVNKYSDMDVAIAQNPKRFVVGVEQEWRQNIKLLASIEYGTWGTGDPPMWVWHYGLTEDVKQWEISLGASIPIGIPQAGAPEAIAGIVEGRVINRITNEPISAMLNIPKLSAEIKTDINGKYKLILPGGTYTIALNLSNYEPYTQEITVKSGETTNIDFVLTPLQ